MKFDLDGKRAVISGSTAGIGFAVAEKLAEAGAAIVINGRSENGVRDAARRLAARVPKAHIDGVAADLSTAAGSARLTAAAADADILVNNLGIFEPKPFGEITDEDWNRFFQTNVMSGVRLSRHYLPGMMARNWGRIVFISSESALNIPTEMIHYGMTKTAELAIARGLAETAAGTGVTVNAVLPGPTRSEGVAAFMKKMSGGRDRSEAEIEADFIAENRPSSLLKRLITVEEVAIMVAYVCSREASATTGAALRVDGGVVRAIA